MKGRYGRMLGFGVIAAVWLCWLLASSGAFAAGENCLSFPVIHRVEGVAFYTDRAYSVMDPELRRRNDALLSGISGMMLYVEKNLDNAAAAAAPANCAFEVIHEWAGQGAMLDPPTTTQGRIERAKFAIGLDVIALKLRALGYGVDAPILDWLKDLDDAVITYFERGTNRANLYTWSGVAAAGFALLSGDRRAIGYEDEVWRAGIGEITPEGFLPKELTRAHRALIYHQYAFSALLMLRQMRLALGENDSIADDAALSRLARRIGANLCDPRPIATASGASQEMPDQTAYRVPDTFDAGFLDADWAKCGIVPSRYNDVSLGGRLERTAALLRAVAGKRGLGPPTGSYRPSRN
jgi:poly(beta-D-mannuronate) lyase